jgi:hypothetical protein
LEHTAPEILHLHSYFLFPFSIDKAAVQQDHTKIWARRQHWIEGLDDWIAEHSAESQVASILGPWKRSAYSRFDIESQAYQDMVFFHPFVRREQNVSYRWLFARNGFSSGNNRISKYLLPKK